MVVHLQVAQTLDYGTEEILSGLIGRYREVGKMLTRLVERWH
jgi:hypothetical protein